MTKGVTMPVRILKLIEKQPGIHADVLFEQSYRGWLPRMDDDKREETWERFCTILLGLRDEGSIVSRRLFDGGGWWPTAEASSKHIEEVRHGDSRV